MANKSRTQGHNWERKCIGYLAELLSLTSYSPKAKNLADSQIGSARYFSTAMDDMGIDIYKRDDVPRKFYLLKEQCKKTMTRAKTVRKFDVKPLFDVITRGEEIPILMTKFTKGNVKRDTPLGEFVTLKHKDFLKFTDVIKKKYVSNVVLREEVYIKAKSEYKVNVLPLLNKQYDYLSYGLSGEINSRIIMMTMQTYLEILKQYVNE